MKNREKYRDEIMEAIKRRRADNDNMCRFLRDNVIPRFASEADVEREVCGNLECYTCANLFAFWLDEEYIEPPKPEVDWDKVPVDTLVRVRDGERIDGDGCKGDGWYYDGEKRPDNCPFMEVEDE